MRVKRTLLIAAVGCGCLGFALQGAQKKYVILDDKKGGFKIYDVESVLGSFEPDGDYGFEAKGSPMRGFSKKQGLVFSARAMDGVASRTEDGSFRIKNAKATGEVLIDVTSTGTDDATTKSHVETGTLTLAESESDATITFPAAFTFTNHAVSSTVDRLLEVKSPSGVFVLPPLNQDSKSSNPFKSADVRGPVSVTVDTRTKVADGTKREVIKVGADRMTYDGTARVMRLEGHVLVDVDVTPPRGEPYGYVSNFEWIEIMFDEDSVVTGTRTGAGGSSGKGGGGR
jgi:hypothetical protein